MVTQPTSIRLNSDTFERVRADADRDKRSISKQIEYMLEQYYKLQNMLQK